MALHNSTLVFDKIQQNFITPLGWESGTSQEGVYYSGEEYLNIRFHLPIHLEMVFKVLFWGDLTYTYVL